MYVCLIPYEKELQQRAMSQLVYDKAIHQGVAPVTVVIAAGQEALGRTRRIGGHVRNLGRAGWLSLVLGKSILWAEILPTRLLASAKVMIDTNTMHSVCCVVHVVVILSLICIPGRNPSVTWGPCKPKGSRSAHACRGKVRTPSRAFFSHCTTLGSLL